MRELSEREATLIKEYEQEKAAIKAREAINKNVMKSVFEEFQEDFENFNWKTEINAIRPWNGKVFHTTIPHAEEYKVKQAISNLITANLKVKSTGNIPLAKYEEVKEKTQLILKIIRG